MVISLFMKDDRTVAWNYRGKSLLNTTSKVYEKLLMKDYDLSQMFFFLKNREDFEWAVLGRLFYLRILIEKRREFNLETHLAFVDYEKAFDRVNAYAFYGILCIRVVILNIL